MSEGKRGVPRALVACAVVASLLLACGLLPYGIYRLFGVEDAVVYRPPFSNRGGIWRTALVIAIDDLRADHLEAYGYGFDTAPNVSALAADAVVFNDYVPASVATGPCLATLLTGESPWAHGFLSAHDAGRHRLPESAETLAEVLSAAGCRTVGAVSLRQLEHRLSGLGQGFDVFDDAALPRSGAPRAADEVLAAVRDDLERALAEDAPVFGFVHLGDLRERDGDDDRFLAAQLAPFSLGGDVPPSGVEEVRRVVGRRRGSPEWLAFRSAIYDGQIHALDRVVGDLIDLLRDAGRYEDALVVIVGTRGRFLKEERPPDGAPEPFSEGLLGAPLIVKFAGAPPWWTLDDDLRARTVGTVDVAATLRATFGPTSQAVLLRRRRDADLAPSPEGRSLGDFDPTDPFPPGFALVAGPGLRVGAVVERDWKFVFPIGAPAAARVFERADDREVSDPALDPAISNETDGWFAAARAFPEFHGLVLTVELDEAAPIDLSLRSPRGDLVGVDIEPGAAPVVPRVSPAGTRIGLSFRGSATVQVRTAARSTPIVLELAELLGRHEVHVEGAALLPPAADPNARPSIRIARISTGWRVLHVEGRPGDRGRTARVVILAYPPKEAAQSPEVRSVDGVKVTDLPGRGGVVVEGTVPFSAEFRLRAKQRAALIASIDGETLPWSEITSESGGSGLELYLPPWTAAEILGHDLGAASSTRVRVERLYAGRPPEGTPDLTADERAFLRRLGPYE